MPKKIFFYIILILIPLTFFLWIHFGIILSAETLRLFKISDQKYFNSEKCYRAACNINYKKYDWAKRHFFEIIELKSNKVFSGSTLWKDGNYSGETINISSNENIRTTKQSSKILDDKSIYIFGGSVAWGFGAKDDLTFPSLIANEFKLKTYNYAQQGWTSSQNLVELMRLISQGKKLDYVIFLDGINDAIELCNRNNNYLNISSLATKSIQEKINRDDFKSTTFESFLSTFRSFGTFLKYRFVKDYHIKKQKKVMEVQKYDCHVNKEKAENVTNYALKNWEMAKILTEHQGGKFFLILQPNPFFDNTKMYHTNDIFDLALQDKTYKRSITLFFNTISKKLSDESYFLDLKSIFKNKYDYIYSDWAGHFSPEGYNDILFEFKRNFAKDFGL